MDTFHKVHKIMEHTLAVNIDQDFTVFTFNVNIRKHNEHMYMMTYTKKNVGVIVNAYYRWDDVYMLTPGDDCPEFMYNFYNKKFIYIIIRGTKKLVDISDYPNMTVVDLPIDKSRIFMNDEDDHMISRYIYWVWQNRFQHWMKNNG